MTTVESPIESALAQIDVLRSAVRGRVLTSADDGWEMARLPWNVAVDQQPAAVVEVASADDVRQTVLFAAQHGLAVSAQPSGHGATYAVNGTILLRTATLDEIRLDAEAGVARVGAGVKWGALMDRLSGTGLVGLMGSNPDVTVVGYLLGGGLSWFSRKYGMACGALRAVELVGPDGNLRWVTDETEPEVMWALRGGGGRMGIVTAVEVEVQHEPAVYGGKLMFPVAEAREVLRAFRTACEDAPRELTLWATILHFPPLPELPEPLRGQSFVSLDVTHLGDAETAERHIGPLRAAGTVLMDTVQPLAAGDVGGVAQEPTDPTPSVWWSTTLTNMDEGTIDRLVAAAGDRRTTPLFSIQIRHLGGALGAVTAAQQDRQCARPVNEPFLLFAMGIPMPPTAEALPAAFEALRDVTGPEATDRTVPTFLGLNEELSRCLDEAALERLTAVKRSVDPDDLIRSNYPLGAATS